MFLTDELFDYSNSFFNEMFYKAKYPWQILPTIKNAICEYIKKGLPRYKLLCDLVLIGENVIIDKNVTLVGPCIIGSNTIIRTGAYIRENVIIGQNCVIGNSTELKNSILMDGVQAPHYNYVGDSIVGNKVHLGAGVICSNLKNNKSNVSIGFDKIDTNLRKAGAFIGDCADIGCGCVLNPGTVIGKNTISYPLISLRGVYPASVVIKNNDNIIERRT